MHAYEQPIFNNKCVMGYNRHRVAVRQWVDGAWQVTKEGVGYFKFNKNENVVHLPTRRAVKSRGGGGGGGHRAKTSLVRSQWLTCSTLGTMGTIPLHPTTGPHWCSPA